MYNLIIKDILIQKKQLIFSLIYLIFILVAFQSINEGMYAAGLGAFTYMLIMTACAYEEKNKSDLMLNSLPIKRVHIVAAKYMSLYLYFIIGTIMYGLLVWIVSMFQIPIKSYPLSLEMIFSGFAVVSLLGGIWLPLYFKMGYMKMRVVSFILFLGFFFITSLFVQLMKEENKSPWIKSVVDFFNTQSEPVILLFLTLIFIIFMFVSFGLSLRFYNSKEF